MEVLMAGPTRRLALLSSVYLSYRLISSCFKVRIVRAVRAFPVGLPNPESHSSRPWTSMFERVYLAQFVLPLSATERCLIASAGRRSIFSVATASVIVVTTSKRVISRNSPQATMSLEYQSTMTSRNMKPSPTCTQVQSIPQSRFGAHDVCSRISAGGSIGVCSAHEFVIKPMRLHHFGNLGFTYESEALSLK